MILQGEIRRNMKALLIIDIQNDYFPGGANPLEGTEEALANAKKLLVWFRKNNKPVIHLQHTSKTSSFFKEGTKGAEIHGELKPIDREVHLIKHYPSAFRETRLKQVLDDTGIKQLVICGMMTHMCIDTTVRAANDLDYEVELIHDACATKDLKWKESIIPGANVHMAYLAALNGTFARILSTEEFCREELLRQAQ